MQQERLAGAAVLCCVHHIYQPPLEGGFTSAKGRDVIRPIRDSLGRGARFGVRLR